MSKMAKDIGKSKAKSALERIADLEQALQNILEAINKMFEQQHSRIGAVEQVVEAIGREVVEYNFQVTIQAIGLDKATQAAETAKANLKKALEDGVIVVSEIVGEKSVICGVETNKDGEVIPPGYLQVTYDSLRPEVKEKAMGQAVGAKVELPAGGTYEIQAVYDIVEKSEEAAVQEDVTPVADESASAAQ